MSEPATPPGPHRIVIVGGGAGGLELATRLGDTLGKQGLAQFVPVGDDIFQEIMAGLGGRGLGGADDVGEALAPGAGVVGAEDFDEQILEVFGEGGKGGVEAGEGAPGGLDEAPGEIAG